MMILWAGTAVDAKYSGGTGEPNDPYRIANAEDLNDIGNYEEDWNKHFILVNDVNLAQYTGTQFNRIGKAWNNAFTGVFDGNDHKIWNFTWDSNGIAGVGLFGYVGNGGLVKNLGIENVDVNAINGGFVGGLVGENWGTITNCYSTGSVSGSSLVGGLVGYSEENGTITNCYSTGSVSGTGDAVGGLVGENCWSGTITNCYSTGSVTGDNYVGGLVGENYWYGTISNCYSTGNVTGTEGVGGLVGWNGHCFPDEFECRPAPGLIYKSYSTGRVKGSSNVGGLVGVHIAGEVGASFWDVDTSTQTTSAGGTPKTTAEMKTIATFTDADWDFIEIWGIGENQTYPFLRFAPAGDLNYDKKVDLLDFAILASHWLEGPP